MVRRTLNLEGVRIGFRNFAGKEGLYNKEGDRSFSIFFDDPELVEALEEEGWYIKYPKERDFAEGEEDTRTPYLDVNVSYKGGTPKVVVINGEVQTQLGEDEVGMLDWADIINVDVVLRPYHWSMQGKSGIKAYLKSIYVTLEEDRFVQKYGV